MRINNIIQLLKTNKFYGISKNVDIAKGVNEYTYDIKKIYYNHLRKILRKK